ncbi:hypothetical protein SLEP1_g1645 [Rubroshorea leprosula]|uniref:WRKY domain-containing protein n=1 Tax=Rubroshorea leprosula TaxID=152421 RepID=A0AAV5HEF8_9ROSI|nr:hypothetical protein SLEP1_g1645 [Rubroshorea leprosula]
MAGRQSCEVPQAQMEKRHREQQNDQLEEEEEDEDDLEPEEEEEEDEGEATPVSEFRGVELVDGAESRETHSETLVVAERRDNDRRAGLLENSTSELQGGSELKVQVEVSHQVALPSSTTQCDDAAQTQYQLQSSASSPTVPEESLSLQKVNGTSMPEANRQSCPDLKIVSVVPILKTPVFDGYNWRKYGQKQVKSPKGSRSYYRCTHSECHAKKTEFSDDTGNLIEIVNKGLHSHDPPRKNNCTRESRIVSSAGPFIGNSVTEQSIRMRNDSDPSTYSKESMQEMTVVPERKLQYSSYSDRNGKTEVKEEHEREPAPKRRVKKDSMDSPDSEVKPGKKHKFVLHAAGDVGISGDGYRWRKYGQKMVKGNSHPRNYYRCTSAGCPVRKQIETSVDNSNAVMVTYKGVHDHDKPVPKKRRGPSSAQVVAATATAPAPAAMNNEQLKKADTAQSQITPTQWSVGTEGELTGEALDLGGEKAMESARTLLSIGFEIKPC